MDEDTQEALMLWMTFLGKQGLSRVGTESTVPLLVFKQDATLQVAGWLPMSSICRKVVGIKIIITGALGHAVVSV